MCDKNELTKITSEVVDEVMNVLGDKLHKIFLYGSYARGDYSPDSDIDIMIILDCSADETREYRKEISKIASRVGLKNDKLVSLLLRDKDSFYNQVEHFPFYNNIIREGKSIYG